MRTVKCRTCGTPKWRGDICAGCAAGAPVSTIGGRAHSALTVTAKHGFHAPVQTPLTARKLEAIDNGWR